mgnify:CR=1 FL=1
MKMKHIGLAYTAIAAAVTLLGGTGCCHQHVAEHYGIARRYYGGTERAFQDNRSVIIDGRTLVKMWRDTDYRAHDSYIVVDLDTHSNRWIDPGTMPSNIIGASSLPFEQRQFMNMSAARDDFLSRDEPLVVYQQDLFYRDTSGTNVVWIHYYPGGEEWRDRAAYPAYYFVYGGAWVIDVVTAPIQFLSQLIIYPFIPKWKD